MQKPHGYTGWVDIDRTRLANAAVAERIDWFEYRVNLQRDGGQALRDMNEATQGAFFPFTVEWPFLQIMQGYFNECTTTRADIAGCEHRRQ